MTNKDIEVVDNYEDQSISGEDLIEASGGVLHIPKEDGFKYLIYEPIGSIGLDSYYLWYCEGRRGLNVIKKVEVEEEKKIFYCIDIDGQIYHFSGKPLMVSNDKLCKLLNIPSLENIKKWLKNEYPIPDSKEIYQIVLNYFKVFGDFEETYHPHILTLGVFQTYFLELLMAVFYLTIDGNFGSGKTAILKAMCSISFHSLLADSISPAFRVRYAERFKPTWFQDELDQTEQDEGLGMAIARTGYERGSFFGRWNMDKDEPDLLGHFAPSNYTLHEDPRDLPFLSRSIARITVSKSKNFKVPIINQVRTKFSEKITTLLYFYRFEALTKAFSKGLEVNKLNIDLNDLSKEDFDVEVMRAALYDLLTERFIEREKNLLMKLLGRDAQLIYVALTIENLLGVDLLDNLVDSVNRKIEEEKIPIDSRQEYFIQLLQSYIESKKLKETYTFGEKPKDEDVKALLKNFTSQLDAWCKGNNTKPPRTQTLGAWLRDIGFRIGKTEKRTMNGMQLTFTKEIVKSIEEASEIQPISTDDLSQKKLEHV